MYLMSPEEGDCDHYEFGWIPHQLPAESHKLTRDDQGLFIPYHDLAIVAAVEDALKVFSDDLPHQTSIIVATIMQRCDCTKRTAERYLSKLVAEGRVSRVGRGQYQRVTRPTN